MKWTIFSTTFRGVGKDMRECAWQISAGTNRYGDGPHHDICLVTSSREDAEAICEAHNKGIA